jgi:hypothetical protein
MAKVEQSDLLDAKQVAQFVADGFLVLESIIPAHLNEAVYQDEQNIQEQGYNFWNNSAALREVFDLPSVRGIIQSLLGENHKYDHSFLHKVAPGHLKAQDWHVDSLINPYPGQFDIQIFYFAHDTPREMGPTLVLPGSHLRRVSYQSVSRYKNFKGQKQLAVKAGTIVVWHADIWHCAQPNYTDKTRYVFKIRLNPGQLQRNLFNTHGYSDPEILSILKVPQPWAGEEYKADVEQKIKLWNHLVGNDEALQGRYKAIK